MVIRENIGNTSRGGKLKTDGHYDFGLNQFQGTGAAISGWYSGFERQVQQKETGYLS